ncbi:MAG: hypothetical protein AAF206_05410 [Bacteroidota bacterium]
MQLMLIFASLLSPNTSLLNERNKLRQCTAYEASLAIDEIVSNNWRGIGKFARKFQS